MMCSLLAYKRVGLWAHLKNRRWGCGECGPYPQKSEVWLISIWTATCTCRNGIVMVSLKWAWASHKITTHSFGNRLLRSVMYRLYIARVMTAILHHYSWQMKLVKSGMPHKQ